MAVIAAFLAPMFLGITSGDVALARLAAVEAVNAYRARDHADLIAIAQIIAYGLAALGSLSLSMEADRSVSMTLRLRGNANALNRSAEQNRRVTRDRRPASHAFATMDAAEVEPHDPWYEAAAVARVATAQQLVTDSGIRSQPAEPSHAVARRTRPRRALPPRAFPPTARPATTRLPSAPPLKAFPSRARRPRARPPEAFPPRACPPRALPRRALSPRAFSSRVPPPPAAPPFPAAGDRAPCRLPFPPRLSPSVRSRGCGPRR
jgi:hypothetical protein